MVLALVGDSTMTSEPPFVAPAACASGSTGAAAFTGFAFFGFACSGVAAFSVAFSRVAVFGVAFLFFFTALFLATTYQPFVNGEGEHLHHPAPCRASRTSSSATACTYFR